MPARSGVAVRVRRGQQICVSDPDGAQVGDLFVFVDEGRRELREHLSAAHTRGHTSRLFPEVGEEFVTQDRRPVLRLVGDDSPGHHDMLIPACDPERYRLLGAPGHASCAANLAAALSDLGLRSDVVPQPVNVFMNIPVQAGGELRWLSAQSSPGDAVTFASLADVVVVLSACPQDLVDINSGTPTGLRLDVLDPA